MGSSFINTSQAGTDFTDPKLLLQQTKLNNTHEQSIIKENNLHDQSMLNLRITHENDLKKKDLGIIGCLLGGRDNIVLNISSILILLIMIVGVIFTIIILNTSKESQSIGVIDLWSIFTPLLTLIMGYIFGNKINNSN